MERLKNRTVLWKFFGGKLEKTKVIQSASKIGVLSL